MVGLASGIDCTWQSSADSGAARAQARARERSRSGRRSAPAAARSGARFGWRHHELSSAREARRLRRTRQGSPKLLAARVKRGLGQAACRQCTRNTSAAGNATVALSRMRSHGLRSPAHAHRVFRRRRHAAHRRRGRRRRRRRPGRAGDHRPQQPVRRGQVLQRGARAPASSRSSAPRSGSSAEAARRQPSRLVAAGAEPRGLPQPVRAAVARLAATTRSARRRAIEVGVARRAAATG